MPPSAVRCVPARQVATSVSRLLRPPSQSCRAARSVFRSARRRLGAHLACVCRSAGHPHEVVHTKPVAIYRRTARLRARPCRARRSLKKLRALRYSAAVARAFLSLGRPRTAIEPLRDKRDRRLLVVNSRRKKRGGTLRNKQTGLTSILLAAVTVGGIGLLPGSASAQTPSPLGEWQYSVGIALQKMWQP